MKISSFTWEDAPQRDARADAESPAQTNWFGWVAAALGVWLASCAVVVALFRGGAGHPTNQGWGVVAVLTVLSAVLAVLLLRRTTVFPATPQARDAAVVNGLRPLPLGAKLALALLLVGGLGLGYWLSWIVVADGLRSRLMDVASVERSYLQAWIQEEQNEIRAWSARPLFGADVTLLEDKLTPSEALLQQVRVLNALTRERNYAQITLRDPVTGRRWISSGGEPDAPDDVHEALELVRSAAPPGKTRLVRPDPRSVPQRELKVFVLMTATARGQVAILQVNISVDDLFLQHMGLASSRLSEALETLLVQRNGKGVMILNDSAQLGHALAARFVDNPSANSIWAVLRAQGDQGFARGRGESGDSVMAYATPVTNTNWVLVTTIEERQAVSQLNAIFLLASAMATCILVVVAQWWQRSKRQSAESSRLATERARHAEEIAGLSDQVVAAQEAERHHLAMELHDHVGANLAAVSLNLKYLERHLSSLDDENAVLIQETNGLLAETVLTIRDFCTQLRPSVLDYAGLEAAIQTCANQLRRRTGMQVACTVVGQLRQRPAALELAIFRMVQEALLNCERHAAAKSLRIELREDAGGLHLEIEDDGRGFDSTSLGQKVDGSGNGISNMRHRAQLAGGSFHIRSSPRSGTHIDIYLPGR